MLASNIRDIYLVDELQLGQRLNESLQTSNHADFALMLSMLSADVTDTTIVNEKAVSQGIVGDEALRRKFNLPQPVKKYAEPCDFSAGANMADVLHIQGLNSIRLHNCLHQPPLCPVRYDIALEVLAELPPLKQEKLRRQFNGLETQSVPLMESGDGFLVLDEIKEAKALAS